MLVSRLGKRLPRCFRATHCMAAQANAIKHKETCSLPLKTHMEATVVACWWKASAQNDLQGCLRQAVHAYDSARLHVPSCACMVTEPAATRLAGHDLQVVHSRRGSC